MTTEEQIKVMQAYVEGKTIQIYNYGEWKDWNDTEWNWKDYDYRIKPEYEGPYCRAKRWDGTMKFEMHEDGGFVRREAFDRLKKYTRQLMVGDLIFASGNFESGIIWQEILRLSRGE